MSATHPDDPQAVTGRPGSRPSRGTRVSLGSRGVLACAALVVVVVVVGSLVLLDAAPPDASRSAPAAGENWAAIPVIAAPPDEGTLLPEAASLPTALDSDGNRPGSGTSLPPDAPQPLLQSLHGSIVDDRGLPLERAVVRIRSTGTPDAPAVRPDKAATLSNAAGEFEFAERPPAHWVVSARLDGHTPASRTVEAAGMATGQPIELVLPRTGSIHGLVLDAEGKPAIRRQVRAHRAGSPASGYRASSTDAQGRFGIENVWPGRYVLSLWIDNVAVPVPPGSRQVEVLAGEVHVVELRLPPPGRVTGRVLYLGRPVPEVAVTFLSGAMSVRAWTDKNGMYQLEAPVPCQGHVVAVRTEVGTTPWEPVEIVAGYTSTVDLRFGDTRLPVRVLNAHTKEPVPNAFVTVDVLRNGKPSGRPITRNTGKDGRMTAAHLYPGTWRLSTVHLRYLEPAPTDVGVTENGAPEVTLMLVPGANVRGVVRDPDGNPTHPYLRVHLLPRGSPKHELSMGGYLVMGGTWEARALPGGDYDVFAVDGKHPHSDVDRARLEEIAAARSAVHLVEGKTIKHEIRLPAAH